MVKPRFAKTRSATLSARKTGCERPRIEWEAAMRVRGGKLLLLVGALALSQPNTSLAADLFRVGTSGDYAPFSSELDQAPDAFEGFDIAIARAYAKDRGLEAEFIRFRWRDLTAALQADRFDVAMSQPGRGCDGLD